MGSSKKGNMFGILGNLTAAEARVVVFSSLFALGFVVMKLRTK